jgi:hypothetical protein
MPGDTNLILPFCGFCLWPNQVAAALALEYTKTYWAAVGVDAFIVLVTLGIPLPLRFVPPVLAFLIIFGKNRTPVSIWCYNIIQRLVT